MSARLAVDVLIPSLDRPDRLSRALASLKRVQELEPDLELRAQVITAREGAARGAAVARNLAAARGSAEYIAFLDDDDEWIGPRLTPALAILAADPEVVLVAGDAELLSGGHFLRGKPLQHAQDHQALTLDCFVCTSTVTMRRCDWEVAGGMAEDLRRAEDYDLWLRLTRDGRKVYLLRGSLARYDDGPDGLSADPLAMARATAKVLQRSASVHNTRAWRDRLGRLEAVASHGAAKAGDRAEARRLALRALGHSPTSRVAWTSVFRAMRSLIPGVTRLGITAFVLSLAVTCCLFTAPGQAHADGFDQLQWGASRAEVSTIYSGRILSSDSNKARPSGTEGEVVRLLEDMEIFGEGVEVEGHFHHDKLAVVRLIFQRLHEGTTKKVIEVYSPDKGTPLRSIRANGGRKTTTWSWPWDGLELRSISEGGELKYHRLDISAPLKGRWLSADAAVCSILPGSSTCNLEHRFCPSTPSAPKKHRQEHSLDVAGKEGRVTCAYVEQDLSTISLAIPEATDVTADWLELIFESRLGEGSELRNERGSSTVQLRTAWEQHGVDMLVVRKAFVETPKGWTGPVEFLRIRRVVGPPKP